MAHGHSRNYTTLTDATELAIPRDIREVDALPVLGTGKLDYVTMGGLAAA